MIGTSISFRFIVTLLELVMAIISGTVTAFFHFRYTLSIVCEDREAARIPFEVRYPFDFATHYNSRIDYDCNETVLQAGNGNGTEIEIYTKSEDLFAKYFVQVAIVSAVYATVVFFGLLAKAFTKIPKKHPKSWRLVFYTDVLMTGVMVILWGVTFHFWGNGYNKLKRLTDPAKFGKAHAICRDPHSTCEANVDVDWLMLDLGMTLGFASLVIWGLEFCIIFARAVKPAANSDDEENPLTDISQDSRLHQKQFHSLVLRKMLQN